MSRAAQLNTTVGRADIPIAVPSYPALFCNKMSNS
jgi:hypothetical protein